MSLPDTPHHNPAERKGESGESPQEGQGTLVSEQEARMTVRDMVKDWLVCNGYDGLWCDMGSDACGCGLEDLFPCGEVSEDLCSMAKRGEDGLFYPVSGGNYRKDMEA